MNYNNMEQNGDINSTMSTAIEVFLNNEFSITWNNRLDIFLVINYFTKHEHPRFFRCY